MTKRVAALVWCATTLAALIASNFCQAATSKNSQAASRVVALAAAQFPNLTRAERALLENADVKNIARGEYAVAGVSNQADDPSNDPKDAAAWDSQRDVRASLIRWMSVDPEAIRLIDPQGIKLLGARITGKLDLSRVHIPFAIELRNCAVPEPIELTAAEIPLLSLQGSYTGSIHAPGMNVSNLLSLEQVHLTGIAIFAGATLGSFDANDGHFNYAGEPGYYLAPIRGVLNLAYANIKGPVNLNGFEAEGEVELSSARIGGDLNCISGHFFNPGSIAIAAIGTNIDGVFNLESAESVGYVFKNGGPVRIKGVLLFRGTHIGRGFIAIQVIFSGPTVPPLSLGGPAIKPLGLSAPNMRVGLLFFWRDVTLENGAQVDLTGASVDYLGDDERSWPAPGNLHIDGLSYSGFQPGLAPIDADTRLKWIALQPEYHPQPYRQLAKVLREMGDEKGAVKVLVAEGDARYRQMGLLGRLLGTFLKYTIGYGHRPLLALLWSLGVVLIGSVVVAIAQRANLMRPTWPENAPTEHRKSYERLRPLVYSLDVFLPFVNLHQEQYWWPDADASGQYPIFGQSFQFGGDLFRIYLWAQIIAGWLLSAIFIAGVTGVIRND